MTRRLNPLTFGMLLAGAAAAVGGYGAVAGAKSDRTQNLIVVAVALAIALYFYRASTFVASIPADDTAA